VTESQGFEYVPVPSGDVDGLIWLDLDKNGSFDEEYDPDFPRLPLTLTLNEYQLPAPQRTQRTAPLRCMKRAPLESSSSRSTSLSSLRTSAEWASHRSMREFASRTEPCIPIRRFGCVGGSQTASSTHLMT